MGSFFPALSLLLPWLLVVVVIIFVVVVSSFIFRPWVLFLLLVSLFEFFSVVLTISEVLETEAPLFSLNLEAFLELFCVFWVLWVSFISVLVIVICFCTFPLLSSLITVFVILEEVSLGEAAIKPLLTFVSSFIIIFSSLIIGLTSVFEVISFLWVFRTDP